MASLMKPSVPCGNIHEADMQFCFCFQTNCTGLHVMYNSLKLLYNAHVRKQSFVCPNERLFNLIGYLISERLYIFMHGALKAYAMQRQRKSRGVE